MKKGKDLTGQQFGLLTAIARLPPHGKNGSYMWVCDCECGGTAIVRTSDLLNGHTLSCGCYKHMQKNIRTSDTRLYNIWSNMKQRCSNPNNKNYRYYGGRGIKVCSEWQKFEAFYYWAVSNGYKDGLTIERKDNDGNYEPSNCEWITRVRQHRNTTRTRRYKMYGKVFTLTELCRIYGVPRTTVQGRLNKGEPIEKALKKYRRSKMNDKLLELSDRLKALKDRKAEIEKDLKDTNAEIDGVTAEMIELMTTDELESFNRNGTTFSMVTQVFPSPEPERKSDLWDVMKKNGFEDLFTINSQTLSATLKELISENEGVIPEWLDGLIKITEKNSIRVTKSK